jgi:hypothetical protein
MIHIPHELPDEFPSEARYIGRLTQTDREFKRFADRYDAINGDIHRIESEEQPTTDDVLERLKKERLAVKDEIAAFLTRLESRM